MNLIGPEHFCGIIETAIIIFRRQWMLNKSHSGMVEQFTKTETRQILNREFLKEPSPKLTEHLLSQNRKNTRVLAGLPTAHCKYKHVYKIGMEVKTLCRFCQEREKTVVHVLCYSRQRFLPRR